MPYSGFFLLIVLLLTGCVHAISDETLRLVDRSVSFALLKENPDKYIGSQVLLGGTIASVKNTKQGSELEIVQFRLDSDNKPEESYNSGGRFLAQSANFLDPVIYKSGRPVTVAGEVKGHKTTPLDQIEYTYPIISIRELYLWKEPESYGYPYPYPYYYPYYPYDLWWPRPFRPGPFMW
jgi:outer membrane lipoprotein